MASREWSELSKGSKAYYRGEGITPGPYNRWWSMPQRERTELTRQAKDAGYDSGLKFMAVQAQVRQSTGRRITTRTSPKEAAKKIIGGQKGPRRTRARAMVPKLFDFSEFDRLEWTDFMSP